MPGFPSITGKELARKLADQIKRLPITICKNAKVTNLIKCANGIAVHLNNGKILQAKTVFIGTGITPRKLNVPGEEFLPLGRPHDAQDRHGTKAIVVGGGDEACSAAMHLANDGAEVIMVVRNSVMRARTHFAEPVFGHANIKVVKPDKVVGIEKTSQGFGFNLASAGKINVDAGFIRIGVIPLLPPIEPAPKLHLDGRLMVDSQGQTTIAGIYGGGDVTRVPSEQYVVAANSDGILTARRISNQLAP